MQSAPSFAWLDEFRQLGPGQLQDMTGRLAAVEPRCRRRALIRACRCGRSSCGGGI